MTILTTRVARRFAWCLAMPALLVTSGSCTKLTEVPHDALTPANAFHTQAEILAGVAGVYSTLRAVEWVGYITLEDLTTDVSIVPTRGSDWADNGQWLDLHRQTFGPNSPAGLSPINGAWVNLFQGVARANVVLNGIANVNFASKTTVTAELRVLRAF